LRKPTELLQKKSKITIRRRQVVAVGWLFGKLCRQLARQQKRLAVVLLRRGIFAQQLMDMADPLVGPARLSLHLEIFSVLLEKRLVKGEGLFQQSSPHRLHSRDVG